MWLPYWLLLATINAIAAGWWAGDGGNGWMLFATLMVVICSAAAIVEAVKGLPQ